MSKECCATDDHLEVSLPKHVHKNHNSSKVGQLKLFLAPAFSLVLLLLGLYFDNLWKPVWFESSIRFIWYFIAYLPVGIPVLKEAVESIQKKDVFSEFLLMSIATLGAFAIHEYPEGVAVMLFYAVGEAFQDMAVKRAKTNIKSLLDQRPDESTIITDKGTKTIKAEAVIVGDIIQLKAGEKLALDGVLLDERASFNTAALTGESKPDTKKCGDTILAGMINLDTPCQVKVTTKYEDSKLSKILELVQEATSHKAPTELFIRKFARIYTPIVVFLALAICILPYFFVKDYVFDTWLYRALIFLVISCPCALVISIPLGYFGGIGAASRNGILFKGSNFLDKITEVKHVVMDKTGTLTEGVFQVQEIVFNSNINKELMLSYVSTLEKLSSHPVATAIHEYVGNIEKPVVIDNAEEIAGYGLRGSIEGNELLVGNFKLMDKYQIQYDVDPSQIVYTLIAVAYAGQFVGYITIADRIKDGAKAAIAKLHKMGIQTTMLSGDKDNVVQFVAKSLGIDYAFGDLLPADKVSKVKSIKTESGAVAFVGDGVNDAPVVALSDVGIAMGGLGSDATIETADIVIQDDEPIKIATAITIGKQTKRIVWQNILLAFVVKAIVLVLGADGLATMWEAVFADVGVALLAIVNAIRIQRMSFN